MLYRTGWRTKWRQGLHLATGRALLGGGAFSPLSIPGLQLWLKADAGLTLSVAPYTGTGTTVAQNGNTLTGVTTIFLSEVVIGDNISGANGLNGNVTAIASDTSLTLSSSAIIGAETPYTITPVAGVSDRVTTWADQSGLGNNFHQVTLRTAAANKLSIQNGKPAVLADGANDIMACVNNIVMTGTASLLAVIKPTRVTVGPSDLLATNYNGTTQEDYLFEINRTDSKQSTGWGNVVIHTGATNLVINTTVLIEQIRSGSSGSWLSDFWVNGASDNTQGSTAVNPNGGAFSTNLFSSSAAMNTFPGYLMELLVYNGALNSAQRVQLENYLNSCWVVF